MQKLIDEIKKTSGDMARRGWAESNGGNISIKMLCLLIVILIAVYLSSKRFATGQAVVICLGGGYWVLAYDLKGTEIGRFFNSIG